MEPVLPRTQNGSRAGFGLSNLEKRIATKTAKRNDGQAIENKRFREIADSAPSMISMTCTPDANRLVSFGETNPFVFAIFGLVNVRNETGAPGRRP
jgi:ABC-type uncharacterized transport system substrate-binding protein